MGPLFEEVCREYIHLRWAARHGGVIRRVGRHWERDWDLDVGAEDSRSRLLAGECKWTRAPVGRDPLAQFQSRAADHVLLAKRRVGLPLGEEGIVRQAQPDAEVRPRGCEQLCAIPLNLGAWEPRDDIADLPEVVLEGTQATARSRSRSVRRRPRYCW
jgi:hypothetical protein